MVWRGMTHCHDPNLGSSWRQFDGLGPGLCRALGLASGGALALSQRISGEVLTQFLFYLDMVLRGWGEPCGMTGTFVVFFFCGRIDDILGLFQEWQHIFRSFRGETGVNTAVLFIKSHERTPRHKTRSRFRLPGVLDLGEDLTCWELP